MKIKQTAGYSLPALVALGLTSNVSGQLYWDPLGNNHWDLISENWDNNAATDNFVVWDNTGSQEAIFESNGLAEIADGGVTVGDLSTTVSLTLQSFTDNLGLVTIKPGGATWNTGGLDIHFINNQLNDTPLSISSGDTLTVSGGGTFDTGEKPNGADWTAAGAILDFTEATFIRGNPGSVGQFDTVRLPGGSSYIHERNTGQTYTNNWELGAGVVRFSNRWDRQHEHDGLVSGEGTLQIDAMGGQYVRLKNAANSFSGGWV